MNKSKVRPIHAAGQPRPGTRRPCFSASVFQYFRAPVLALAAGLFTAGAAVAGEELRPNYQPLAPGLDYAHVQMTNWNRSEPWSIHIARLDRSRKDLHLSSMLAYNQVFGTAPVSAIAQGVPRSASIALAAVNTGFCINRPDPYLGMPRGLVISEGQLISGPAKYSFWMNEDGAMHFGKVEADFSVTLPGGRTVPIGLNRECTPDTVVLFTHRLGDSTRATNNLELVLETPEGKALFWRADHRYSLRVRAVNSSGNTSLSNTVAALSIGSEVAATVGEVTTGSMITIDLATDANLGKAVTACQAIFPVVRNGEVPSEFDSSPYMKQKHPRTIIGFNAQYFFMVVVDGRKKDLSTGMVPEEMGRLMVLLGCTEAMNMDGGGSTTFWANGRVRNSVAGSRERDRSDALVIVKRPVASGVGGR